MAVEKSFVIKNGLEVNKSLLVANEDLQRVGVQSAVPEYTLDVRGGIGATDLYVGSAATVSNTFTVGSGNSSLVYANIGITSAGIGSIGIGTNSPGYLVEINSPVSTGQTAVFVRGDAYITGKINVGTGSTQGQGSDLIIDGNVEVIGISTFDKHVDIKETLNVIGIATFGSDVFINSDLTVYGNYYGDGSTLSGIVTQIIGGNGVNVNPSSGIGAVEVSVASSEFIANIALENNQYPLGAGFTTLNFQTQRFSPAGVGVTVITTQGSNSGLATIAVTPGISIGLAIALS